MSYRKVLLNMSVPGGAGWVTASLLFITNNFKAHWFCSIADKMLYQLLNVKSHFYCSFSWNIRQKVPLRWFPLSRKPLHLLHPGNGKAATWSPSAASESCRSAWPLSIVLISPTYTDAMDTEHHIRDAPVIQGRKSITCLSWKC